MPRWPSASPLSADGGGGAAKRASAWRPAPRLPAPAPARGKPRLGRTLGKTERQSVASVSAQAGQREIDARAKWKARKIQAAPTSGKKPMPTSGIAKTKRSPATRMRGVHRETDAPAHRDAVHQGDDRFRICLDPPIELIFLTPESPLLRHARPRGRARKGAGCPRRRKTPRSPAPSKRIRSTAPVPLPYVERGGNQPTMTKVSAFSAFGRFEHNNAGAAAARESASSSEGARLRRRRPPRAPRRSPWRHRRSPRCHRLHAGDRARDRMASPRRCRARMPQGAT